MSAGTLAPKCAATSDCTDKAVVLIVSVTDDPCIGALGAWPACADHAPEEVHEARSSMDESEFVVVEINS